jgi:hypothetical protein
VAWPRDPKILPPKPCHKADLFSESEGIGAWHGDCLLRDKLGPRLCKWE